ncbi:MAG: peptidoglycan DD-metalloendopeptidase family protein [Patescibacteria group bacterium]|jgi:murein DD-endopeptidase MepM/ murein hydrolase activator NlpD
MTQNKKPKINRAKILVTSLILSFIIAGFSVLPKIISAAAIDGSATVENKPDDIAELNNKIEDRRKQIDILQKEVDAYADQIKSKQQEAKGLQNQIAILENEVAKVNLDIETTEMKIEQTNLEIQKLNLQIKEIEDKIADNKQKIAGYIRLINRNDQVGYLKILLVNDSFSDFFDQIKYTQEIHTNLKNTVDKLKGNQKDLQTEKASWEIKAKLEEDLKTQLQEQKSELTEKNNAKQILFSQAKLTERQYQKYTYQLQLEQQQINADIATLEKTVRKKLEEQEQNQRFQDFGPARLGWPVSPGRGISAYFHDPDYPFRYIFEHPAIDIRAGQGTPIKAPENGYVARIQFKGDKSYAYIMLIHNDGLSTVFGHVSAVYVKGDAYVTKGQVIGLSGGLPGSPGAGPLTTGPHLHFEVRLNGIPVNPLEYLPAL